MSQLWEKIQKQETTGWLEIKFIDHQGKTFSVLLPKESLRHFCEGAGVRLRLVCIL